MVLQSSEVCKIVGNLATWLTPQQSNVHNVKNNITQFGASTSKIERSSGLSKTGRQSAGILVVFLWEFCPLVCTPKKSHFVVDIPVEQKV